MGFRTPCLESSSRKKGGGKNEFSFYRQLPIGNKALGLLADAAS